MLLTFPQASLFYCLVIIFKSVLYEFEVKVNLEYPVTTLCSDNNVYFASYFSTCSSLFLFGYIYRTRCFANPFWMNLRWRCILQSLLTTMSSHQGCCLFCVHFSFQWCKLYWWYWQKQERGWTIGSTHCDTLSSRYPYLHEELRICFILHIMFLQFVCFFFHGWLTN